MQILAGKDKGAQGKVATVIRKENRVIVGGLNTVSLSSKLDSVALASLCSYH